MKKISVTVCVYLWIIILCFSTTAQDFKTIQDGIEYAEITRQIEKTPVKMNLLRLDLTKVRLDVVHAMDAAIGTETVSSMAKRHGAFAAINAGFFRLDHSIFAGDAVGVLQIDGKLFSENNSKRVALVIENKLNSTEIAITKMNLRAILKGRIGYVYPNGINRQREKDDFVIYTPVFHRTTLTDNNGIEIVVRRNKVFQAVFGKGSSLIPDDGFVMSFSGTEMELVKSVPKIGTKIEFLGLVFDRIDTPILDVFSEDIVGGVPQLVKNGKIDITWEQEGTTRSFVETRHPRTAVATLKDGKFLVITVDGRSEESGGIGLEDLAKILLELGAVDAMNLDGGGSTTMFLDGKIVNKPSDKEGERKVGDAILVFPRIKK